ncbi:uncharacterized protein MG328-like [Macrobrachium nipponense]|uniref:uncharacterized protein MG328-like n=1 Tax=Macrobrachium nipponense TaxID=159736 RepID=UPI0030C7B978
MASECVDDDDLKLRGELDIWKHGFYMAEQKNQKLREELTYRKDAEESLQQRVCDLEKRLANEKARHFNDLLHNVKIQEDKFMKKDSEAKNVIDQLKREVELYLHERKKFMEREHELVEEINIKSEKEASLQRTIKSLEGDLTTHREALKKLNEDKMLLISRQENEIDELVEKFHRTLTLTNLERDQLKQVKESIQEEKSLQEMENTRLRGIIETLENENQELVKDIYQWDKDTVAFEQRILQLQTGISDLEKENEELRRFNMEKEAIINLQEIHLRAQHQMIIDANTRMAVVEAEMNQERIEEPEEESDDLDSDSEDSKDTENSAGHSESSQDSAVSEEEDENEENEAQSRQGSAQQGPTYICRNRKCPRKCKRRRIQRGNYCCACNICRHRRR